MKYLVANFKANLGENEINQWIEEFTKEKPADNDQLQVVICPSFLHLFKFKNLVSNSQVKLGAQDLSLYPQGAYTGEISAQALKEQKVEFVILGHSERRRYFKENNEMVLEKVKRALNSSITPIVCLDKDNFKQQIDLLNQTPATSNQQLIYAYEPLEAIGTGEPENPAAAANIISQIKNLTKSPVLYGGSVDENNAGLFLKQTVIDGLLVATASLKASNLHKICQSLHE